MKLSAALSIDFYKSGHKFQYPDGTELVYSNFTPRSNKLSNVPMKNIVFFGLQYFIKDFLIDAWNETFFNRDKDEVVVEYKRVMDLALGKDSVDVSHIAELHDLGYLPLVIKALPEGSLVPMKTPVVTMYNTLPKFSWITNYLESVMSTYLWKISTSATTAFSYRKLCEEYGKRTGTNKEFLKFQCHDFSFRGMSGLEDAASSGAGHLTSFTGSDTVPSIQFIEQFYNTKMEDTLIAASVSATEHSVMCLNSTENELETFRRLINEVYPSGMVSIVSDTWDYWKVLNEYLPTLKQDILNRIGKVIIRPDSGNPVDIICGNTSSIDISEYKGSVELLWDLFGGTVNEKGYRVLDSHIGLIYGDSITYERAEEIFKKLEAKGFSSDNVVFGTGSYSYQYVTRDTWGFAMKATYGVVNGEPRNIYKDPVTDSGTKKSAKGLIKVNEDFSITDECTWEQEPAGLLREVFRDGKLLIDETFVNIRNRIDSNF